MVTSALGMPASRSECSSSTAPGRHSGSEAARPAMTPDFHSSMISSTPIGTPSSWNRSAAARSPEPISELRISGVSSMP